MAKGKIANPASALGEATRFADLRARLLFLAGALIVYRIGTFIPVPGIDPVALEQFFQEQSGTILSMFNMFSGGALQRLSIFALGIMPYISATIIFQLLTVVIPALEALKKEGEQGQKKIQQWSRYATIVLALFQSFLMALALERCAHSASMAEVSEWITKIASAALDVRAEAVAEIESLEHSSPSKIREALDSGVFTDPTGPPSKATRHASTR